MINHKYTVGTLASAVTLLLASHAGIVNADQGVSDSKNTTAVNVPVLPALRYINTQHVANGVALAGRTSGTIHLRGVPGDAVVDKAWLYYNYSDKNAVGDDFSQAYIDGHRVSGKKVADNTDPCWGAAGNHTYRANVTPFLPKSKPNGDYNISLRVAGNEMTPGGNPWVAGGNNMKGATLVVVYKNNTAPYATSVIIYDDLNGTMFSGVGAFELDNPLAANAAAGLFTMSGADGQRGFAHNNANSNELTFLNGVQIAGPSVASGDWDGSDGWPLPQLWDTHTHSVTFAGGTEKLEYQSNGDCLVPVVFVLQL